MKKKFIYSILSFLFLIIHLLCFSQRATIDSLLTVLKTAKEDTSKVNILNDLSDDLSNGANYEKALLEANEAIVLSEKISFEKGKTDGLSRVAKVYYCQGNYSKALEYFFKSLKIDEAIGNKKAIPVTLSNIGLIYNDQGAYSKALEYYEEALKKSEEVGDKAAIGRSFGNIGNVYIHKGANEKALEYYFKSIKINDEQGDSREKAINMSNVGIIYCQQGYYDKALNCFFEGLKIRKELGDKRGIEINLGNIGEVYVMQKKYDDAKKYLQMALKNAGEINDLEGVMGVYHSLSDLYEKQNLWQSSLGYYKQYTNSKDSLFNEAQSKQITEMQTKYESEKKDKELILKEAELDKRQAEAKQQALERDTFIIGFVLMIVFAGFIYRSLYVTKKQKGVIETQKEKVEIQNEEITKQKHLVEEKNQQISDSISYAKRIQSAFLTSETYIKRHLSDYFILYKPRDVVSGDFYWMHQKGDYFYFCVADCTGHGIPGAFMSLIGMGVLNEIVFSKNIDDTNDILNELRRIVILSVNPEGALEEGKDGMDLVLLRVHLSKKELQYSASNNSFYICRKGELLEFKGDKMPVGSFGEYEKPFSQHTVSLEEGDIVYASTDGFPDQFGGPKGKKLKYKLLEELLQSNASEPMRIQSEKLNNKFNEWKGDLEQVDDVTIVGIKI